MAVRTLSTPTTIPADHVTVISVEACSIIDKHAMVMIQVDNVLHEDGSDWTPFRPKRPETWPALCRELRLRSSSSALEGKAVIKLTPEAAGWSAERRRHHRGPRVRQRTREVLTIEACVVTGQDPTLER